MSPQDFVQAVVQMAHADRTNDTGALDWLIRTAQAIRPEPDRFEERLVDAFNANLRSVSGLLCHYRLYQQYPTPQTFQSLSAGLDMRNASFTGFADRAEKAGTVIRLHDKEDRRRGMLELTPLGAELLSSIL